MIIPIGYSYSEGDNTMILETEKNQIRKTFYKLQELMTELRSCNIDFEDLDVYEVYKSLNQIKEIMGNFNNDISFVSCLMAKEFLETQFHLKEFDVSEKSQSASGLDIEVYTEDSKRIVAEIKTTCPYKTNDFGSNQIESLRNDFRKLRTAQADYKFLFVTEKSAYEVLERKYSKEIDGIILILLERRSFNNEIRVSQFVDSRLVDAFDKTNNVQEILEKAFKGAYRKAFGEDENFLVDLEYLKEDRDIAIRFYEYKEIVEDVYSEKAEIELAEARKISIVAELGDKMLVPFDKTLFSKESLLYALKIIYRELNISYDESTSGKSFPSYTGTARPSRWHSYYEEYKPYHRRTPITKAEEEVDEEYGDGYFDNGPDPFPFDGSDTEDDYSDDSWA